MIIVEERRFKNTVLMKKPENILQASNARAGRPSDNYETIQKLSSMSGALGVKGNNTFNNLPKSAAASGEKDLPSNGAAHNN